MSYTVNFHKEGSPLLTSYTSIGNCDACDKNELIQVLPAERTKEELYRVQLCKVCLLRLVAELEE